jgi:tRNA(Arg) A34 adenosine deaminase TadA
VNKQHSIKAILYDKKGNILSIGSNSYTKTHPLQAKYANQVGEPKKIFLHSEIDAIIKCKDISKAYRIEVYRFYKDGKPANAKPCKICENALNQLGIQVWHT